MDYSNPAFWAKTRVQMCLDDLNEGLVEGTLCARDIRAVMARLEGVLAALSLLEQKV